MPEERIAPLDLIDLRQFESVASMLGSEFGGLLTEFFTECGRFADVLESRASAGDLAGMKEICHEIKGTSAQLGFSAISRRAAKWEETVHPDELAGLTSIKTSFLELTEQTRLHISTIS